MIEFLFLLPSLITPANAVAAQVAEGFTAPGKIGFVLLAIILGPVIILTIASMFGTPRNFRVPGLFIGSVILLIGAIIVVFAISGMLLRFIVPQ